MKEIIIPLNISAELLWGVVGLVIIFFIIFGMVFSYHWRYYGIEGNHRVFVKSIYFIGGIVLILAMVVFLGAYAYAK